MGPRLIALVLYFVFPVSVRLYPYMLALHSEAIPTACLFRMKLRMRREHAFVQSILSQVQACKVKCIFAEALGPYLNI